MKVIDLWKQPCARVLAERELEQAEREYLEALSAFQYWDSQSQYHASRISRLREYLKEEEARDA